MGTDVAGSPWVRFRIHETEYALPLEAVSEVTPFPQPRLIPLVPLHVGGVVNARGEPLAAVNGGVLLQNAPTRSHRYALVLEQGTARLGVLVDSVSRIERGLGEAPRGPVDDPGEVPSGPGFVRWVSLDGEKLGLVDPEALATAAADLLSGHALHRGEKQWRNAF